MTCSRWCSGGSLLLMKALLHSSSTLPTAAKKLKAFFLRASVSNTSNTSTVAELKEIKLNNVVDSQDVAELMLSILDEGKSWLPTESALAAVSTVSALPAVPTKSALAAGPAGPAVPAEPAVHIVPAVSAQPITAVLTESALAAALTESRQAEE